MSRLYRSLTSGVIAAMLLAGGAAAESKVRVTNTAVNPVTFSLDGKSKDIRPRKGLTYTVDSMNPTYSLFFHNGVMDRGEVDLSAAPTVTGPDGLEYRCLTLREDGFDFDLQDVCDGKVNKKK